MGIHFLFYIVFITSFFVDKNLESEYLIYLYYKLFVTLIEYLLHINSLFITINLSFDMWITY